MLAGRPTTNADGLSSGRGPSHRATATSHLDAFDRQQLRLAQFVPRHETALASDDPPPRQSLGVGEDLSHGPGTADVTSQNGHLPVGEEISWRRRAKYSFHVVRQGPSGQHIHLVNVLDQPMRHGASVRALRGWVGILRWCPPARPPPA